MNEKHKFVERTEKSVILEWGISI